MALKIRLRQQGRKNQIMYRLVLSDSRAPRDGKYIEVLGWYNPLEKDPSKSLKVENERLLHWLNHGAILSESAQHLVKKVAPDVMEAFNKKQLSARAKACLKRKAARKKAAGAAA